MHNIFLLLLRKQGRLSLYSLFSAVLTIVRSNDIRCSAAGGDENYNRLNAKNGVHVFVPSLPYGLFAIRELYSAK